MKGLAFAVAASLFSLLTSSASAAVVRPENKVTNQLLVQDYLSSFNPTISIIEASQVPASTQGYQVSNNSIHEAVAALSTPFFAPSTKDSSAMSAFVMPTTGRGSKHNAFSDPPPSDPPGDPLAATPEPAAASLVLLGLFATGLLFARRSPARAS